MAASTEIVNATKKPLKVQVGNRNYVSDLATVEAGAKYIMEVDFNATYQEYVMGVDAEGKELTVDSDDLCDNKCITIKEEDGKINVHKQPREASTASTNIDAVGKPKSRWIPAWMSR